MKYRTLNEYKSSTLNLTLFSILNMANLLCDRIQEIIDSGFSQADLYRAAGVTKGTSNMWLNGKIKSIKLEYAQASNRFKTLYGMNGFYAQATALLKSGGFYFVRQGKGSHEIWGNGSISISVPSNCKSRHTANAILKEANLKDRM